MSPVTAVILSGGGGTRFWPLSSDKVLFPFMGKPLITHTYLHKLPRFVTDLIIVANPKNETYFRSLSFPFPHRVAVQATPGGMADAVLSAKNYIPDGPLLVLNGDDVFDDSVIPGVINHAEESGAFGVLAGWKVPHHMPLGYMKFDGERISEIIEKPAAGEEPSTYAEIVVHYFRDGHTFIREIENTSSPHDDVYEKALSSLMKREKTIMYGYDGFFASMKYPWHVLEIMDRFLSDIESYRGENVVIKENVFIEGNVYMDDGVKIFENTKITGPCYIGKNTIVGNNNIIRGSHIGDNCITGFNTDITRSYIGDECWFHSNYVGDSIMESGDSMGSGTVLANLRLDEAAIRSHIKGNITESHRDKLGAIIGTGVRIGVNVSVMPGKKIGAGSFVGAGCIVDRDVPDGSFFLMQGNPVIVPNAHSISGEGREKFRKKI